MSTIEYYCGLEDKGEIAFGLQCGDRPYWRETCPLPLMETEMEGRTRLSGGLELSICNKQHNTEVLPSVS